MNAVLSLAVGQIGSLAAVKKVELTKKQKSGPNRTTFKHLIPAKST